MLILHGTVLKGIATHHLKPLLDWNSSIAGMSLLDPPLFSLTLSQ